MQPGVLAPGRDHVWCQAGSPNAKCNGMLAWIASIFLHSILEGKMRGKVPAAEFTDLALQQACWIPGPVPDLSEECCCQLGKSLGKKVKSWVVIFARIFLAAYFRGK